MDYIGSKAKLLEWIFSVIDTTSDFEPRQVFLDACSGTGAVSRAAAKRGYNVLANDLMFFPAALAEGSIGLSQGELVEIRERLRYVNNELQGVEGFFYREYSGDGDDPDARLYFTQENAMKLDAFRNYLDTIPNPKVKAHLLYSGIEALSRVSNTAGTHGAYLKKFKERARVPILFREEEHFAGSVTTFSRDIRALLADDTYREVYQENILYIDPPYNYRQYGANYHLYEVFARNDSPTVKGKTGLRNWKEESKSDFCRKDECLALLRDILDTTTAHHVYMSYSSDGLLSKDDIMGMSPNTQCFQKEYRRYKADSSKARKYDKSDLYEYLFVFSL